MNPTILTCAVTGTFPTRQHNPHLPVTPQEIAVACIGAAKAGAAICHIHVREPATGLLSMNIAYYREVVARLRASDTDLIINLTTGPGGRFVPSDDVPSKAAPSPLRAISGHCQGGTAKKFRAEPFGLRQSYCRPTKRKRRDCSRSSQRSK
jgi:uncharacterized protein (DUF849 family)